MKEFPDKILSCSCVTSSGFDSETTNYFVQGTDHRTTRNKQQITSHSPRKNIQSIIFLRIFSFLFLCWELRV